MPFLQATSAAGGGGVLGDENRMVSHGRLFAVVGGFRRGEPLLDEVPGVLQDGFQAFLLKVRRFPAAKPKAAAELRPFQCLE